MAEDPYRDARLRKLKRLREHVEREFYDTPVGERKQITRFLINMLLDQI